MSISDKDAQSLLSHEEYEAFSSAHHPAIYSLDKDGLRNLALRLEGYRDKARTFARQKRREVKGTSDAGARAFQVLPITLRGGSKCLPKLSSV